MPRALVNKCPKCDSEFSMKRWKRNCFCQSQNLLPILNLGLFSAGCGHIFCSDCVTAEASIREFGFEKPKNICALCNETLPIVREELRKIEGRKSVAPAQ